jgi:hypothetical protein
MAPSLHREGRRFESVTAHQKIKDLSLNSKQKHKQAAGAALNCLEMRLDDGMGPLFTMRHRQ